MTVITKKHRLKVIKEAIAREDAEVRSSSTIFIHMRAGAAQPHANSLSQGNYEPEGFCAVFVLPEDVIRVLTDKAKESN